GQIRILDRGHEASRFNRALTEKGVERLDRATSPADLALPFVEDRELRIDSRGDRILLQQPLAKAVDGGDIGCFYLPPDAGIRGKSSRHLVLHVGSGFLGESNSQNLARQDALEDQLAVTFHQYGGLPGTGTSDDAGVLTQAPDVDGRE